MYDSTHSPAAKTDVALQEVIDKARAILQRYGVTEAAVVGSFARNAQTDLSDVDILAVLPQHLSLLDVGGLQHDLEQALKRRIDLIDKSRVKPAFREHMTAKQAPIF